MELPLRRLSVLSRLPYFGIVGLVTLPVFPVRIWKNCTPFCPVGALRPREAGMCLVGRGMGQGQRRRQVERSQSLDLKQH